MFGWNWFIDSHRVLIFVGVQAVIAVINALLMKRLSAFPSTQDRLRVSVLLPVRDEAAHAGACISSLLAQDYDDLELLVLDDGSTDETAAILARLAHPRLRVLSGQPLPSGWVGKSWACQQLADAATGELLLFTDADTIHAPATVRRAVAALAATRADLLTAVTRNEVLTLGEQVTVPFLVWSIGTLLPLGLAYLLCRTSGFSAANGKFMLFQRSAYERIGGHAAVRDDATEDLALCRLVKRHNLRWRLMDASAEVSARMYSGFSEAVEGFSKNFFALFGYRLLPALFVWCWMLLITWHPLASVAAGIGLGRYDGRFAAAVATVLLTGLLWLLVALKYRMPKRLALLYPLTIIVCAYVGLRSIVLTASGQTTWKGRVLTRHRVRLL
jgi:chlorobactene glucosyltransferase